MTAFSVIPQPVSLTPVPETCTLTADTRIRVTHGPGEAVAAWLATLLRRPTGHHLPVVASSAPAVGDTGGDIALLLDDPERLGREGHLLDIGHQGVRLRAHTAEGLFRGVQTLRQLLPPGVEHAGARPGPWTIPGVRVEDHPRFAWRGVMLDVARHFFAVDTVKRFIDQAAAYKINILHLHLTDDQGWRLAIDRWPRLATYGGGTEVGGGAGGHYSKAEYRAIVEHAAARHMTVVPEIDVPGHTNAALASYPELNPGGRAPDRYTGIEVGFSSLDAHAEITYRFLGDVIDEVAELTPGPYLHIGGDEAHSTDPADYARFLARAQRIIGERGKTVVAWQDAASAPLTRGALVQYWRPAKGSEPDTRAARDAVRQGARVIMSPADHAYLDGKYHSGTPLGLDWAGHVGVRDSYAWDPATLVDGVEEQDIAGVEAPLWTETVTGAGDIDFMTFPRLPALAEIGWSPARGRSWESYRDRLAAHGARWTAAGVAFYRSPEVPWAG
ncbi:beta-N-acetylhexosaminidase [Actinomadura alba]|uniref:beta-N-acetylhexosaminidase n=1 Tax=Actinomadura alba TaxID=406431 RepID=A0ABR7LYS9_9ACTN|nr:beta-N-acetylhexosaminidase [Actinomadura alba]MBC6470015.1 beta-N-acetylhexosaminidase [Actinomadura alba]